MESQANQLRRRAILIARDVKWLFHAIPERFFKSIARRTLTGAILRWLFLSPEGQVHRAGEIVLADLRQFCAGQRLFDPDPLVMARRAGRREAFERLIHYLNLDEGTVQKLMELDDGIG